MRLPPAGKRSGLSHRLCPPGLPGRRSRAAQALVAPAGAKLPRLTITIAGLVFLAQALPFVDRRTAGGAGERPLRGPTSPSTAVDTSPFRGGTA